MPKFFSIAGIRTVGKPNPQVPSASQNNQNVNLNETNATKSSDNEGTTAAANATTSQFNNHATATKNANANAASNPSNQEPQQPQSLFHKYPGSGKLTIQQKKGKTGHTKSVIRRVPIYTEDYNSSDDEDMNQHRADVHIPQSLLLQDDETILLDELDNEITRQEEQELLDEWNDKITAQEEVDLMKRLWINIEHAAYLEHCAAKPSAVLVVEDPLSYNNDRRPLLSVKMPKSKVPTQLVFPTEITGTVDFCKASIKLPRYLDQEHKILAFTRAEFYTGVFLPFETDLLGEAYKSLNGWDASLLVSEEDPFSYVLQARAERGVLEELKRQAEVWVQDRIRMINSYLLLRDGASVVIDNLVQPRLFEEAVKQEKKAFKKNVVGVLEKNLGWIEKHAKSENRPASLTGWRVSVQFKMHPRPCTIDATGSAEVLAQLAEATRDWVQTQSLYAITDSFESSHLTSSTRGTPSKRIRMTFRYPRCVPLGYENRSQELSKTQIPVQYANCGVSLAGIKERTLLSYMMGGPDAFEKGCTLLTIHGNECNTPNDLQCIYSQARETDRNFVNLTLCLSRYTNFLAIPELMDMNPRRLDSKPFQLSDYKNPDSIEAPMGQVQQQKPAGAEGPPVAEQPLAVSKQPAAVVEEKERDGNFKQPEFAAPDEDAPHQEQPNVPEKNKLKEKDQEKWILRLLENEKSIEMDVIFSSGESLGASCSLCKVKGGGVLLFNPKKDGQLLKVLGNASKSNFVLWKVNGSIVKHFDHLKILVVAAKKSKRPLQCVLVMHEGTDLSQIDKSKLVLGDTANPRRRNGDTHSLEKQLRPTKTSVAANGSNTASRKDETEGSEEEADYAAEWDIDDDDSSDSDVSALISLKKKKTNISKKKSTTSKASASKPGASLEATTRQKGKGRDTLESNPFSDSDSDSAEPTRADLKKRKRVPKNKDSISQGSATNATSTSGKPVSQSADLVVADEAPIPKKRRTIPTTNIVSDRSTSTSGSQALADPNFTTNSSQMRSKVSSIGTSASQKTNNASLATTSRGSNNTNSSGRATSTGATSDPLAELLLVPSKPKLKQKRTQLTQSNEEPAGKKLKGSSVVEAQRNAAKQVSEPPIPRRKSHEPKGSALMQEFQVEFASLRPIGAFFKTEGSKCKVFSVYKKGNAKEDGKIMPGSIAVAASVSGRRQEISSHEELQKLYIEAKNRQSKIRIFFVNTDVFGHRMDMQSDRDWTEYGVWTNRYQGGWAGGAKTKNGVVYMANKLASNRESSAATSIASRTENDRTPRETSGPESLQLRGDSSTRKNPPSDPKPQKRLGPCRIKNPSAPRERRNEKVKFSDDKNEVKYFVVGSATDQYHDDSHAISNEMTIESQPSSPSDVLKDAVTNQRYTKLIEVLETGAPSAFEDTYRALANHHEYAKRAIIEENEHARKKDMQAKKKVLGIYVPICLCIEQVMELGHLSDFTFCVKTVELKKKPKRRTVGRTESLSGKVSIKRGEHVHELGSLHKTNTKAFISYGESERRSFRTTANAELRLSTCYLFIDFREGVFEDAIPAAKLGNVMIPLSKIGRRCPINKPLHVEEDLKVKPDSILSKGAVGIEISRFKASRDAIIKEKEELTKRLYQEISYIKRFNDEFGGGRIRLSGNIRSMGNATLLHAAIHLGEEEMVKRLLDLRADPRMKSSRYGTPIHQAMNLKDRSLEKLQNLINNGDPPERTEPVQHLFDVYSRILRLLKSNEEEELPDDMKGISDDSDEDEDYPGDRSLGSKRKGASGTSEADQKKRQFEIMQEIFSRAPKAAGGLEDGLEANKFFVSGMLRLHYSKECPDVPAMEKFVKEAQDRKVLVSISETKFRLGAATGSQESDILTKEKEVPLPETSLSWLHHGKVVCDHFGTSRGCRYGHHCRDAHVYHYPTDTKSRLVLESKELLKEKRERFVLKPEFLKTLRLDGWFTAGYYNPNKSKSLYFHAEGGKGKANRFGVNWYPALHEAKEALQRVMTAKTLGRYRYNNILSHEENKAHRAQSQTEASSQTKEGNRSLPLLKDRDWMDKSLEFPRCPSGVDPKSCQNQDFWRVEARFGDTIGHQLKIFLDPDDVYPLERNGFHTAAFADRQNKKIIYVEGGNSKINIQGVHWYSSESEARNALEPVVAASRTRSAGS
ncbi:unnamed protein product [Cylindrotheca closterium]|uniref:C3H1-type domain-containing protein n=1 Tax=Cylindrotheca closterium TaxID=2856 RepID=A0AAD2FU84_9STRA|nr:unnamed protein product [Cylindrotheca closterium]